MKMIFETFLLIVIGIILLCLLFYPAGLLMSPGPQQTLNFGSACINDKCFQVELAKTAKEIEKGLMYRKELDSDKGMLFIFDKEGIYPFWMKNTLIPLDIIWIDGDNKVVFIGQNVLPCKSLICPSVNPKIKAKYVLEINAGLTEKHNIKAGDKVEINI